MPTMSAWRTSRLISLTRKRSAYACHIIQQLKRGNVDEILARAGIFQGVEPSAVSALTKQLQPVDFPRGHTVFAEGEPGDRLFIIISGKVKIGRRSPDGRENLLTIMGPSDMFGELSIFDPGPRTSRCAPGSPIALKSLSNCCECWPAGSVAPTTIWPI